MPPANAVRRYVCANCDKSYMKAEHLARHERSHSGLKPFSCGGCHRHFARQDSLLRHQQRIGHEQAEPQASAPQVNTASDIDWTEAQGNSEDFFDANINFTSNLDNHVGDSMNPSIEDPFLQLIWPDSEDLLQSILSNNIDLYPADPEVLQRQAPSPGCNAEASQTSSPWLPQNNASKTCSGTDAVRTVSLIISELSNNVTSNAATTSLSTVFLDECLHLFFEQFIPAFPVCHRPTFSYREWTHPLLINAIAIGSLFLGEPHHIGQGEALWKLAHVAVATSWHTLILHQAPSDHCNGVQLVATALLGQTYAMLSKNRRLRMTAQMFHSLGFYWARECSMYDIRRRFDWVQSLESTSTDTLAERWKQWAAGEVQLRALLGHYILDSQLAQFISAPTSQRHTSNPLPLPCSDLLFGAATAKEWVEALQREPKEMLTFRELFLDLYSDSPECRGLPKKLPSLAIKVAIEGLWSVVLEANSASGPILGHPSAYATNQALGKLYGYLSSSDYLSSGLKTELLLRWHTVCIDAAFDSTAICQDLCSLHKVEQKVFGKRKNGSAKLDFKSWASSPQARKALLHASAVYDNLDKLPLSHAHAIHVPMTIFAAAMIYCALLLGGVSTVAVPDEIDWGSLMTIDAYCSSQSSSFGAQNNALIGFLTGLGRTGSTKARNMLYELNVFSLRLRQTVRPWGISAELEDILRQLVNQRGATSQSQELFRR